MNRVCEIRAAASSPSPSDSSDTVQIFDLYDSNCIRVWHAQSAAWAWARVLAIPTPFVPQGVPHTGKTIFQFYRSQVLAVVRNYGLRHRRACVVPLTLCCAFAMMWLLVAQTVCAEPPEVVCSVSENEVYFGESITYQVDIQNAENPAAPNIAALKDRFLVEFLGDQSRDQSSTMIINGRITQSSSFSHVYQYRLTANSPGTFRIPAVTASIDGKTLTSNAVPVRILEIPVQDAVVTEIIPSQSRAYPTQGFSIKLRILVKPINDYGIDPMRTLKQMRQNPPSIQITWLKTPEGVRAIEEVSEWLQPLISRNNAGFSINEVSGRSGSLFERQKLAVFDLGNGREKRKGLTDTPIDYFVYELDRKFVAEKPGAYAFGPAVVKGTFETRTIAIAPAVTVKVLEVPLPRPANFTGGIGNYRVIATATPNKLRVGDPLTLNLQFTQGKNSGSLDLISAPDLSALPEISDQFDIVDKSPVGRVEGNDKKFAFALRPKRAGVSIPALSLSTFDPTSESFVETVTEPIPISVADASSSIVGGDLVGSVGGGKTTTDMKTRSEGIFHNITDVSQVRDQRLDLWSGLKWVVGLWLCTGIAIASLVAWRRQSSDVERLRRVSARRNALSRLVDAKDMLQQGKTKESLRAIRAAILGLAADTGNQIAEGMTTNDVSAAMKEAGVPIEDQVRLQVLLDRIESAEYGASDAADSTLMVSEASDLIHRVGPFLERRSAR
jgi:hypothetical protein